MGKRGQVTVFIIIGLIVVLVLGIVIYVTSQDELVDEALPEAEIVAEAFTPLQSFVEDCLFDVAKTGLIQIGEQGGYLNPEQLNGIEVNAVVPTDSDAVRLSLDSDLVIPYWWYMKSPNTCTADCVFGTLAPPLVRSQSQGFPSIQEQLEQYVTNELDSCLGNYDALRRQGMQVEEQGSRTVTVSLNRNDVLVGLRMPLTASMADADERLEQFYTVLDVNLRRIYTIATNLTQLEAEYHYLEKHARSYLDIYSDLDADALPPTNEFRAEIGAGTIWIKYDVQKKFENILRQYMGFLQVFGSRNYVTINTDDTLDPELTDALLNRGSVIPLGDASDEFFDHEVRFSWIDWWPIYFDLNCRGQLCQPEATMQFIGIMFGLQRYNFAYDFSIPVLVDIYEPEAFSGEGFSFRFFLETNVRNNEPVTVDYRQFAVPATTLTGSLVCDPAQRAEGVVSITTIDARTKRPIDVPVAYACGTELCGIGMTRNGALETSLPYCIGGTLVAQGKQFTSGRVDLDVFDDSDYNATIEVFNPVPVTVDVKKLRLQKAAETWVASSGQATIPLSTGEEAILVLTKRTLGGEAPLTAVAHIYGNPFSPGYAESVRTMELTPGTYSLVLTMISRNTMRVTPTHVCYQDGAFSFNRECEQLPAEPIEFNQSNPIIIGGATFDVDITEDMLQDGATLEFSGIAFDFQTESLRQNFHVSDLEQLGMINDVARQYEAALQPRVKT